jgi:phosphohistidine phosphatase SixA
VTDAEVLPSAALLCWRPSKERRSSQLDVLLVRGTAEDGTIAWSLPRATPRDGETLPECAVRAVDPRAKPRLGRQLDVPGATAFWAARLRDKAFAGRANLGEGPLPWLPAQEARHLLADPDEQLALSLALDQAAAGVLDTRPVLILRHAKARPRARWSHADAERPLVELGRRQAVALAGLLECWHPEYLLSSPWRRCLDTMSPYVTGQGLRVRTKGGLTELAHRSSPRKAAAHLRGALGKGEPALVCTHRPVLETVMAELSEHSTSVVREAIPRHDPFLGPAEVLVAHVAPRPSSPRPSSGRPSSGRFTVVAVERHRTAV